METVMTQDQTLGGYLRQYFGNLKQVLKNPRSVAISVLLTILISEVQFVLSMMSAKGTIGEFGSIASLLSYANGGMYGGTFGVAGGIIGKMLLMIFLNCFVQALDQKQNPFHSFGAGIAKSFRAFAFKRLYDPAAWLFGVSLSLLTYMLCNVTQNRMNSMIGAYLTVMVIGSLGKKDSFLYGLLLHLFFGRRTQDPYSAQTVTSLMGGSALGYFAGTILSLFGLQLCLQIGLILLIPAFLLLVIGLIVSYATA